MKNNIIVEVKKNTWIEIENVLTNERVELDILIDFFAFKLIYGRKVNFAYQVK